MSAAFPDASEVCQVYYSSLAFDFQANINPSMWLDFNFILTDQATSFWEMDIPSECCVLICNWLGRSVVLLQSSLPVLSVSRCCLAERILWHLASSVPAEVRLTTTGSFGEFYLAFCCRLDACGSAAWMWVFVLSNSASGYDWAHTVDACIHMVELHDYHPC